MNNGEPRDARPALAPPILPDHPPTFGYLDPAAALAFRTPLQEHPPAADTKAAATLTALGIMFPLLAKFEGPLSNLLAGHDAVAVATFVLLIGFAVMSVGVVVQAFRTLSPRFPTAFPSLAFFGDIAGLGRTEYMARVQSLSHEQALYQMYYYNHNLSIICVEKFRQLRREIRFLQGAFACWLVLIVLSSFNAGGY
jgi:hypothetical protein